MYLSPFMRYAYMTPAGIRGGRAIPVTPFESLWHLHLGVLVKKVHAAWCRLAPQTSRCTLHIDKGALMARAPARQIARTEGVWQHRTE
jgi:hypothetical protein